MRYETAPCRLLIWLAAAVLGWAVVVCTVLYPLPALAGLGVAGVLLRRRGERHLGVTIPDDLSALSDTQAELRSTSGDRPLVAHPA